MYITQYIFYQRVVLLLLCSTVAACQEYTLNDPYTQTQGDQDIYYNTFAERPKHLDPVRSYSSNEYVFIGQIYEPPLQYHFLKRPYQLTPLTAVSMPEVIYYDIAGRPIAGDASTEAISKVIYRITIKPNILYQPHPALATSETGQYIYHNLDIEQLRNKHTLADFGKTGTRIVSAADYVYQIKRIAHPQLHSPIASLMSHYILGLSELADELRKDFTQQQRHQSDYGLLDMRQYDLQGAQIIDARTFEITLKEHYPQFIYWLAMVFFAPMPWEADIFYSQPGMAERNLSLDWYPIGSGAFMLSTNNPNRLMVLDKNPNFRGEYFPTTGEPEDAEHGFLDDAGKSIPFIDQAIFTLEKESIPSWNKFLQGYYDTSGIASDSFDQAIQFNVQGETTLTEEMQQKAIQLSVAVTSSIFYTGFNMRDEVIGGKTERARKLRQAIAIAVDFEEFISIFANGRGVPAHGPIPPGIFGSRSNSASVNSYVYNWVNDKPKRKSIDVASKLMSEAGYPDGRDTETGKALVLYLDTLDAGPGSNARFQWLRKQFNKLGITLVIRATNYNRFQEKMQKGTAQIYQWGWNADYPDPENFMFLLYGPNAKFGINGENASNYSNETFDQLFDQMKNMPNNQARQRLIDEMVEIVRRDSPWLWGYHPMAFSLHHDWYKNAKPNLMAHNKLKYKRIIPSIRKQKQQQWNQPIWWPVILILLILFLSLAPAWFFYRKKENATVL